MRFLDIDSPLMQGLSKVADLMILNLLTVLCCLPIITVGPALTALNYMSLKLVRNEDCYVVRGYFKSFKENFKQSTVIWLLMLFIAILLGMDFFILYGADGDGINGIMQILIFIAAFFWLCTALYVFPVLAKFQNTIRATLKNALLMSILQFPKTVVMAIAYLVPLVLFIYFFQVTPIVLFFGISVPAWVSAKLYNNFFKKLEDKYLEEHGLTDSEVGEDDEHIFHDELDETLQDKPVE